MTEKPKMFAREAWVKASEFLPEAQTDVLRRVIQRVDETIADGRRPVVVFDIDSTLYHVTPRTYRIVLDWLASHGAETVNDEAIASLRRLSQGHVGYSLRDTFRMLGIDATKHPFKATFSALKTYWAERFFSNHYLDHDEVYPGAVEFVRTLEKSGAEIVYLTGRDEPNMGSGTRACMARDGFPLAGQNVHFFLKPSAATPDREHKQAAADAIGELGDVVASFENEPGNLIALQSQFPDAMHIFVDTNCSDHPAPPARGLYRVLDFRRA